MKRTKARVIVPRKIVDTPSNGRSVRTMLARQHEEDILALGGMMERFLESDGWQTLYHCIENMKLQALRTSGNQPAERVLGELNGYDKVYEAIERLVLNGRDILTKRQEAEEEVAVTGES